MDLKTNPRLTMLWTPNKVDDCEESESTTVSKNMEFGALLQVFSARVKLVTKLLVEEDELLVDSVE